MSGVISSPRITLSHQLTKVFMKSLTEISYDTICTKLGIFDLYDLA